MQNRLRGAALVQGGLRRPVPVCPAGHTGTAAHMREIPMPRFAMPLFRAGRAEIEHQEDADRRRQRAVLCFFHLDQRAQLMNGAALPVGYFMQGLPHFRLQTDGCTTAINGDVS